MKKEEEQKLTSGPNGLQIRILALVSDGGILIFRKLAHLLRRREIQRHRGGGREIQRFEQKSSYIDLFRVDSSIPCGGYRAGA